MSYYGSLFWYPFCSWPAATPPVRTLDSIKGTLIDPYYGKLKKFLKKNPVSAGSGGARGPEASVGNSTGKLPENLKGSQHSHSDKPGRGSCFTV